MKTLLRDMQQTQNDATSLNFNAKFKQSREQLQQITSDSQLNYDQKCEALDRIMLDSQSHLSSLSKSLRTFSNYSEAIFNNIQLLKQEYYSNRNKFKVLFVL
ncbi:MAG: hypothetical protein MHMPM18_004128 [Marteilia pararefringens]